MAQSAVDVSFLYFIIARNILVLYIVLNFRSGSIPSAAAFYRKHEIPISQYHIRHSHYVDVLHKRPNTRHYLWHYIHRLQTICQWCLSSYHKLLHVDRDFISFDNQLVLLDSRQVTLPIQSISNVLILLSPSHSVLTKKHINLQNAYIFGRVWWMTSNEWCRFPCTSHVQSVYY